MNYKDILAMAEAYAKVAKKEAMDPVDAKELKGKHKDRKDKDIDNDGDVDKSDEYLHKRRKAVSKAMKGKDTEVEVQTQESKLMTQADKIKAMNKSSSAKMKKSMDKLRKAGKTNEEVEELDEASQPKWKVEIGKKHYTVTARNTAEANKKAKNLAVKDGNNGVGGKIERVAEANDLDELSKKTLGSYVKKSAADMSSKDSLDMHKGAMKRYKGIVKATDKLTKEAKDHGNMNNGSPSGEGLSPSAKKELANKTPMNPATDELATNALNFKTFKAMTKKAAMRSNDNAVGDKTPPKAGK